MVFFIDISSKLSLIFSVVGEFCHLCFETVDVISTLNSHFQDWVIFVACNIGKFFVWVRTKYQLWMKLQSKQTFLVKQTF